MFVRYNNNENLCIFMFTFYCVNIITTIKIKYKRVESNYFRICIIASWYLISNEKNLLTNLFYYKNLDTTLTWKEKHYYYYFRLKKSYKKTQNFSKVSCVYFPLKKFNTSYRFMYILRHNLERLIELEFHTYVCNINIPNKIQKPIKSCSIRFKFID